MPSGKMHNKATKKELDRSLYYYDLCRGYSFHCSQTLFLSLLKCRCESDNLIMSLFLHKQGLLILVSADLYIEESIKWKCPLVGEIKGCWSGLHFLRTK